MSALVRLEWERDPAGYEIAESKHDSEWGPIAEYGEGEDFRDFKLLIRPRSERRRKYVLEGTANRVWVDLANTPCTKDGVVAFTNKWGLLNKQETTVGGFFSIIKNLNKAADLAGGVPLEVVERNLKPRGIPLRLRIGRMAGDSTSRLLLDAESLLGFCHAEFLQLVAGGVEIRKCPRCATIMALGKVGQQPTYCSDACRVAMHRRKKRNTVLRLASGASRQAIRA